MFEQLTDVHPPAVTRKSAVRVIAMVFLLGLALGVRFYKFAYYDNWTNWNPFDEIIFWFWVLPACAVIWRYIPAILDKIAAREAQANQDAD